MKFEFVEFYECKLETRPKGFLGTVHIYAIDCNLDIRGIRVVKKGKELYFSLPHFKAVDEESGIFVWYPLIRWTDEKTQKQMMDFLKKEVRPIVKERIKK